MGYIIWIILAILLVGSILIKAGATKKDIPFLAKGLLIHFLKVAILIGAIGLLYFFTPIIRSWIDDWKTKKCVKEFIDKNYHQKEVSLYDAYEQSKEANEFCRRKI